MCAVSTIGDDYTKKWPNNPLNPWGPSDPLLPPYEPLGPFSLGCPVNRVEFEMLKNEVQELKKLLEAAKKFDEATGQKDCEMEEKVAFLKKLAEFVGVDLTEVFKN
jgi:hypothetical protein